MLIYSATVAVEWDPKCAWGESYWCSDLRAAKACGAIGHCSATVWTNQILKQARLLALLCCLIYYYSSSSPIYYYTTVIVLSLLDY